MQMAGISLGLALFLLWLRRILQKRRLFKLCGVPASAYRLLGTSLYRLGQPVNLQKHGLRACPSTVFQGKNKKSGYICHFNPRMFNGRVKVRERYQMLLIMGLAMETLNLDDIQAAIHYRDHLEAIQFEPETYKQLVEMRQEYVEAVKKWTAPNARPLFNRNQHP